MKAVDVMATLQDIQAKAMIAYAAETEAKIIESLKLLGADLDNLSEEQIVELYTFNEVPMPSFGICRIVLVEAKVQAAPKQAVFAIQMRTTRDNDGARIVIDSKTPIVMEGTLKNNIPAAVSLFSRQLGAIA
jgi:hypothetical protein